MPCARSAPSRSCSTASTAPPCSTPSPPRGPTRSCSQMTALAGLSDLRKFERAFALTNRLRTEGTEHLLAAARATGVERVIVQSYAGWPYARTDGPRQGGGRPARPRPAEADAQRRSTPSAARRSSSPRPAAWPCATAASTGRAPGWRRAATSGRRVQARKFPLVGDGGGVWSFIHIEDAAAATLAALEHWTPGEIYNVVDDEPAPVREWLPGLAAAIGAPPPRKVPRWVARLMGEHVVALMCEVRGASNAKARRRARLDAAVADLARGLRGAGRYSRASSSSLMTVFQLRAVAVTPSLLVGQQLRQRRALDAVGVPGVDLAAADHDLLRRHVGGLERAHHGGLRRGREEAHLVALGVVGDVGERVALDDDRELVARCGRPPATRPRAPWRSPSRAPARAARRSRRS